MFWLNKRFPSPPSDARIEMFRRRAGVMAPSSLGAFFRKRRRQPSWMSPSQRLLPSFTKICVWPWNNGCWSWQLTANAGNSGKFMITWFCLLFTFSANVIRNLLTAYDLDKARTPSSHFLTGSHVHRYNRGFGVSWQNSGAEKGNLRWTTNSNSQTQTGALPYFIKTVTFALVTLHR